MKYILDHSLVAGVTVSLVPSTPLRIKQGSDEPVSPYKYSTLTPSSSKRLTLVTPKSKPAPKIDQLFDSNPLVKKRKITFAPVMKFADIPPIPYNDSDTPNHTTMSADDTSTPPSTLTQQWAARCDKDQD